MPSFPKILLLAISCSALIAAAAPSYPLAGERAISPGDTLYFIDPADGDDANAGTQRDAPWQSFHPLNRIHLAPGDRVEILKPGPLDQTLAITGRGTPERPIHVSFAPGRYDFHPEEAYREAYQISNTNSDPEGLKAVCILLQNASHVRISGRGAVIYQRGKAIHTVIDRSAHVVMQGLAFDYHRPTVSEFTVTATGEDHADLEIHPDSAYTVEDGELVWQGEGWTGRANLTQNLDPATGRVFRQVRLFEGLRFEETAPFHVRAHGEHRFQAGRIYQDRNPFRDCVGAFVANSLDVTWRDVHFRFIHGMGVVSQFSEDLVFDGVVFAPPAGSGRTTSAWADCIQASGCRGKVLVKNCVFQGAHDDAINIHGTHLRVVESDPAGRRIKVRFMHDQTFGFQAFFAGDEIEFVRWDNLETYAPNRVEHAEMLDPHHMMLTLADPLPGDLGENDAVENVTWTPSVHIHGCTVRHIPTRGFLITTRRPVLVEDNDFFATHMPGILVECDARGWFESGVVRDMVIRNNRFYHCGRAAIHIHPQNREPNPAVHRNIRIEGNTIYPRGDTAIEASSTTGLHITGNTIHAAKDKPWLKTDNCEDVVVEGNQVPAY